MAVASRAMVKEEIRRLEEALDKLRTAQPRSDRYAMRFARCSKQLQTGAFDVDGSPEHVHAYIPVAASPRRDVTLAETAEPVPTGLPPSIAGAVIGVRRWRDWDRR